MLKKKKESLIWVQKFLKSPINEYLLELPKEYLSEPLIYAWLTEETNLRQPKEAYKLLMSEKRIEVDKIHENTAQLCYYLAHSKFIMTSQGMDAMFERYEAIQFGTCPRFHFNQQTLLPVGLHDEHSKSTVKCFCPKCRDLYHPSVPLFAMLDGAAFGSTFPHVFLQTFLSICPKKPSTSYIPRISGFRIHNTAPELLIYNGELEHNVNLEIK